MIATAVDARTLAALGADLSVDWREEGREQPYDAAPIPCRCDQPIPNREFDVESCLKCGSIRHYFPNGNGANRG